MRWADGRRTTAGRVTTCRRAFGPEACGGPRGSKGGLMGAPLSRRRLIQLIAALAPAAASVRSRAQTAQSNTGAVEPLSASVLPRGARARFVNNVNGIRMHVLEAGFETSPRPAVLLVHGYPELAYSWRKLMLTIASAGYHVIAPALRGYGRSGG